MGTLLFGAAVFQVSPTASNASPYADAPVTMRRLRLTRARWQAAPHRIPVTISGLAPCLPLFGLPNEDRS
jgi:hypothetical protein